MSKHLLFVPRKIAEVNFIGSEIVMTVLKSSKVGISKSHSHGYSLTAIEPIKSRDMFLTIPSVIWKPFSGAEMIKNLNKDLFASISKVASSKLPNNSKSRNRLIESIVMAISLVIPTFIDQSTFRGLYSDLIRSEMPIHPLMMSNEEYLNCLVGSQLHRNIILRQKFYDNIVSLIINQLEEEDKILIKNEFKRGVGTLLSRAISHDSDKSSTVPYTLVPILDFANHDNYNFNAIFCFNKETESFTLQAIRDIKENEEIFINYGQTNSLTFMQLYGFVADVDNPHEISNLSIKLTASTNNNNDEYHNFP
eukprot:gene13171-17647_t